MSSVMDNFLESHFLALEGLQLGAIDASPKQVDDWSRVTGVPSDNALAFGLALLA